MTLKLARAGNRSHDAMIAYLFAKVAMPVACAAVAAFMIFVARVYDGPIAARLLIVVVALGVGAYLPDLYVRNAADKRRKKLQKALPDALDLMVICTEAGLSLDATLQRVSQEFGKSSPELADEFSLTAVELGFLPERRKALDNLSARTDLAALRAMCNTLLQTEKYGTPLAHSLRVLAAELRTERMMKAEEKAARLPAILTVPMIIFILPPLFIVLIGPAILNTIDALSAL
jgi:tight adherence protein C